MGTVTSNETATIS